MGTFHLLKEVEQHPCAWKWRNPIEGFASIPFLFLGKILFLDFDFSPNGGHLWDAISGSALFGVVNEIHMVSK